ncbi:MAG: hypothetical protein JOZ69_22125, partial [Myxococcales bacterium]|nr:hypothetical protein [Myxococcales bacterium]
MPADASGSECPICGAPTRPAGEVDSAFSGRRFLLGHCDACHFTFVRDPRRDYEALYDDAYYAGRGADPSVDFAAEMVDRRTVREYEWRGVLDAVGSLIPIRPSTRWLDFGCGLGGLVRYGRSLGLEGMVGADVGLAQRRARASGIPLLDDGELDRAADEF